MNTLQILHIVAKLFKNLMTNGFMAYRYISKFTFLYGYVSTRLIRIYTSWMHEWISKLQNLTNQNGGVQQGQQSSRIANSQIHSNILIKRKFLNRF